MRNWKIKMCQIYWSAGHGLIPPNALTYHVNTTGVRERFSKDISVGIRGIHGYPRRLANRLLHGFAEIIIIGMDHSFILDGSPNESVMRQVPDPTF